MPLSKKDCQAMHEAYIKTTQEFLRPYIEKGATWVQCQTAIEFGDDEKDEDVVNPLFPEMEGQSLDDTGDEREDHHQAPEPPEDAPYCDMCGGRHEQGHCHDLQ